MKRVLQSWVQKNAETMNLFCCMRETQLLFTFTLKMTQCIISFEYSERFLQEKLWNDKTSFSSEKEHSACSFSSELNHSFWRSFLQCSMLQWMLLHFISSAHEPLQHSVVAEAVEQAIHDILLQSEESSELRMSSHAPETFILTAWMSASQMLFTTWENDKSSSCCVNLFELLFRRMLLCW